MSDGANYIHRYKGHRNSATVKGVNFFGPKSEFIVSGSDCGHVFLWEKSTQDIVQFLEGDEAGVVNVLEPHPTSCILATSGLDHDVKVWAPTGKATDLDGLGKQVKENDDERHSEATRSASPFDERLLFMMFRRFRRRQIRAHERRQARERLDGEEAQSESSEDDDDDDDDEDEDDLSESDTDSEEEPATVQCAPS